MHSWGREDGMSRARAQVSARGTNGLTRVELISPRPACGDNASAGVLTPVLEGVQRTGSVGGEILAEFAQAGPPRQGYSGGTCAPSGLLCEEFASGDHDSGLDGDLHGPDTRAPDLERVPARRGL